MEKERSDKKYGMNTFGNDQYYLFLCQNVLCYDKKVKKNWPFVF